MRRLLVPLLALLLPAVATGSEPGDGVTDVATLACGGAVADAAGFAALAVWLDGWRHGRAHETGYDPMAIAATAAAWRADCAVTPNRTPLELATMDRPFPAPGPGWTDMAFLKCFRFLELADEDRGQAVSVIRWIDGWHAASVGHTTFRAADHDRMTDAAMDACAQPSYHTRNLIHVLAGKHR